MHFVYWKSEKSKSKDRRIIVANGAKLKYCGKKKNIKRRLAYTQCRMQSNQATNEDNRDSEYKNMVGQPGHATKHFGAEPPVTYQKKLKPLQIIDKLQLRLLQKLLLKKWEPNLNGHVSLWSQQEWPSSVA